MPAFTHGSCRLAYREQGAGSLLLILPGNTASSACHEGELEYFGQRYHSVALDYAGTGQSDRIEPWPDDWWERNAHAVAALIEHLGERRAVVMGTSGGAAVALWTAILYPERIAGVIADSEVETFPRGWLSKLVEERQQRTADQIAFWRNAHGDDWAQVVEADSAMIRRFDARGADLFNGRLHEIRCPVLFTASLADDLLPPDAGERLCAMARQVHDSHVVLSSSGGHPLMWSRPELFRKAAMAFLDELAARAGDPGLQLDSI